MAEGQSIKDRDFSQPPLDDEDPLMELSRIIGLEPRRESAPVRSEPAPEFRAEPVDITEEPELALQPDLSVDLQKDLADELIARLEADAEFSLDSEPSMEPVAETPEVYAVEAIEPEAAAEPFTPQSDFPDLPEPDMPRFPVSDAAPTSLEDELEAILSPVVPRSTPFGLRPAAEEIVPEELHAPLVDSHLDMNFDAQSADAPVAEVDWASENAVAFEPAAEAADEIADEHYEAMEPYEAEETPPRSWPPVTVSATPEIQAAAAAIEESQPILETVTHEPRSIEATDEFEVPEFEYEHAEAAPAAEDPLAGYDNDFEPVSYAKPVVAASAPAADELNQRQFDDADFDQINEAIAELEGERIQGAAAITAAGLGAASVTSARQARKEFVLDENDEFAAGLDVPHASKPVERTSSARSYLVAAGLGALALVGGIGAYAWTRGPDTGSTAAAPVVLKADNQPVKIAPENPGGKVVPNQDIAVYDKVAGAEQTSGEPQKVLVSKTEEAVDLAEKATTRVVLPGPSAPDPASAEPAQETAKAEDRAPAATAEDVSPAQAEIASVAAKKVRTMVVKSDGSLVERPVETAAAEPQTSEEDLMKSMADAAVPATKVQTKPVKATEEVGAVAKADPVAEPAAEPVIAAAAPVEPEAAAVAETPEAAAVAEPVQPAKPAVKTVKTKKITQKQVKQEQPQQVAAATNIPLVDARPSDQPVNIVAKTGKTPSAPAPADVSDAVVAAPSAPASGGSYVIQIASAPSPDQAQSTYASLNRKFGKIIGGRDMNIQKADIPGKGTFYRVRITAGSKKEAAALCAKYKSAGGQCLVAR
jgi:hypothetical protein